MQHVRRVVGVAVSGFGPLASRFWLARGKFIRGEPDETHCPVACVGVTGSGGTSVSAPLCTGQFRRLRIG